MKKNIILLTALMLCAVLAQAKITLPSIISDDMVLQQSTEVRLWGWGTPGEKVEVSTSWDEEAQTKVNKDGKWSVLLRTPQASYQLQALNINDISLKVLVGEVWLAGGQSNMEMPLKGFAGACVKDGTLDAMRASQEAPFVRMFNIEKSQKFTPQDNCKGSWLSPTFDNALQFSATAYYYASLMSNALNVPVGIINCSYGGTRVESWCSAETCSKYPDVPVDSVGICTGAMYPWERAVVTYNAMFRPVSPYTVKGIIWYQGCSNVSDSKHYADRLSTMVRQWRDEMAQGDIPFYQVQIAPYIYGDSENGISGALLREQQFLSCDMIPNSDIICTNDLVEPYERHNIHPREKRTVGLRLAMLALNKTYGMKDLPYSGPRYDASKLSVSSDTITVGFTTNNYGICRNYALEGFEIAGEDRVFHTAKADFHWQTNTVTLTSADVPRPVAVRYCFKDFQIGNMIGGGELPLFPFRSDNW